jgi:lipid-A-disaccharide synthase
MAFPSYVLGRMLVKVKNIGLVNIVAGRNVVPELIQNQARPERIAEEIRSLIDDRSRAETVRRELESVGERLGKTGAARRAAEEIVQFLERTPPKVRNISELSGPQGNRF